MGEGRGCGCVCSQRAASLARPNGARRGWLDLIIIGNTRRRGGSAMRPYLDLRREGRDGAVNGRTQVEGRVLSLTMR